MVPRSRLPRHVTSDGNWTWIAGRFTVMFGTVMVPEPRLTLIPGIDAVAPLMLMPGVLNPIWQPRMSPPWNEGATTIGGSGSVPPIAMSKPPPDGEHAPVIATMATPRATSSRGRRALRDGIWLDGTVCMV